MAVDQELFRKLYNAGIPGLAASYLADPDSDTIGAAAVANPAALTSPADIGTVYTEAEVQALRNDVAALRTTVQSLLTALRDAGVLQV